MGIMFGFDGLAVGRRPFLSGGQPLGDREMYFLMVGVVAVALGAIHVVSRSRLGRLLRAMGASPVALATLGASVNVTRVIVFCFSAFLAGVAGALWASFSGTFGSVAFVSLSSLTLLVVLFVVPGGELVGPVLAALAMNIIPSYVQSQTVSELQPAIFGASAVALMALGTGERLERLPFRLPGWLPRDRTEGRVWARRHGPGAVLEGRS